MYETFPFQRPWLFMAVKSEMSQLVALTAKEIVQPKWASTTYQLIYGVGNDGGKN